MSKQFFNEAFHPWKGFVYNYVGTVSDNPTQHITEKFIQAIDTHDVSTTVSEVGDYGWVLYVDRPVTIDDPDFEFLYDLAPEYTDNVPFNPTGPIVPPDFIDTSIPISTTGPAPPGDE
jgi:hypothetical protein